MKGLITLIPGFNFNNMNFSVNGEDGLPKYIGVLNLTCIPVDAGSSNKYEVKGNIKTKEGDEHLIDLMFGIANTSNNIMIAGVDNNAKKRFRLAVTPKIGMSIKFKIDGYYGQHRISLTTGAGTDAIINVIKTLISFMI
jgi:hypothetical protein